MHNWWPWRQFVDVDDSDARVVFFFYSTTQSAGAVILPLTTPSLLIPGQPP